MLSMKLDEVEIRVDRTVMALLRRLAIVPAGRMIVAGTLTLAAIVLLDLAARAAGVRLVPLYVPALCLLSWSMRRTPALIFALVAALVALLPDMLAAAAPLGFATVANAAVRATAYAFLVLIVVAYRESYDDADLRAMHDGLTGVLNKLPFLAAAERQLADARRAHQTLLVAFVGLDEFRTVNAQHGHAGGDAVLRAFAREAMVAVRGSDTVGRLGGDAFGFMLQAASPASATALAHVLHQRLTTALAKSGFRLSCSMGALIVGPQWTANGAELLHMADRIMMRAKREGRGRVVTGSPATDDELAI